MANSNFVVHNGLTVGPLTISATTGDINTTGNISGNVAASQISKNDSSIVITDTGTGSTIVVAIDGVTEGTFNAAGFTVNNGFLNAVGNVIAQAATVNALTVNGNESVTGFLNVTGNVMAAVVTASQFNTPGNVLATGAVLNALTVNGNDTVTGFLNVTGNILATTAEVATVEATGMIYANSTAASTSTTNGAFVTAGGIGVAKDSFFGANVTIQGNLFVNGNVSVFNTNNLSINDAMIYLADDNPADVLDIGFVSAFTSAVRYQHTGFVRDATDGIWKLFANVVAEPTTTVDFTNANYSSLYVGNIQTVASANIGSTLNVVGNILGAAGTLNSLTVNGNVVVTSAYAVPSANAASSLGTSATRWNFVYGVNGNFLSVNANYADLAENYLSDAEYLPGTVLMFGGDQEVTECTHDMCSRVAGVVSTNPGYLMNQGLEGEHTVELALTGRVPTKVQGTVAKGDMMVSAGNGRARAEANPKVGSVIGKALENFDGLEGVIEVVVGKH